MHLSTKLAAHGASLLALLALAPAARAQETPAARAQAPTTDELAVADAGEWVELFDGRSLAGWTEKGGRYDGDADWTVEDGCIVGRQSADGQGGLLYTEGVYTSFELELEARIDHPFDSGIFVRMWPEGKGAQVTLDYREGGEVGALYSDGFLAHNEEAKARFRAGEWNRFRVQCTGFDLHVRAWMNGEPITDHRLEPGTPGYAPSGRIGLQVHGSRDDPPGNAARFRNVRVRELPVFDGRFFSRGEHGTVPTRGGELAGWRPLFDGESLAGWETDGADGWRARDGRIECLKSGGGSWLRSARDYRDFRLRVDFRIARMANSGVYLRARRDGGNPSYTGCELQILDDFDWEAVTGTELAPWQLTGSLYGALPAGPTKLNPPGEWNRYEVLFRGPRLAVALNGRTLYDVDTRTLAAEPPFAQRAAEGFVGFQRYSAEHVEGEVSVAFRDVLLQRLEPLTVEAGAPGQGGGGR